MKNVTVKAVALAIAAALPGFAQANVDLNDDSGASTFASELVAFEDAVIDPAGGILTPDAIDVTVDLGFGVSTGQTRYIRFNLTNATFASAVSAADLQEFDGDVADALPGASEITVAQGGQAGSDFVIFQITSDSNYLETDELELTLAGVGIDVDDESDDVEISYSLYETAADAANERATGLLADASGVLANIASGIEISATPNLTTASVTSRYTEFLRDGSSNQGVTVDLAKLHDISMVAADGVLNLDGDQVALSDLLGEDTTLVLSGVDMSAALAIFADADGDDVDCNTASIDGTIVGNTASIEVGNEDIPAAQVCFEVGLTPEEAADDVQRDKIVAQVFSASLEPDLLGVAAVTAVVTVADAGSFNRDGTSLKAPWIAQKSGTVNYVQIANVGNEDAPYDVTCLKPTGATTDGDSGVVTAGNTERVKYADLGCDAGTTAVEVTLEAPAGTVVGSVVRVNNSTGDTGIDSLQ